MTDAPQLPVILTPGDLTSFYCSPQSLAPICNPQTHMYMNKIKMRITTLDIILHIEWRGKEKYYGIKGKVYWQTDTLTVMALYLLFLEMCVFAGICGGQEMGLNCSLGDCELPGVGAGDQPGSSSSVHFKPQSQLCSPGSDFQIGLLCEKRIERNRLWNENYFISHIKCY